jgi:hypothetical protein
MAVRSGPAVWSRWRIAAWALAALVVVVFVAANAHLVAVSVASQPDCVPHEGGAATYRAAKPAC